MKTDYTNLSFTELIDKIEDNRFFDLPRMVREAFKRLIPQTPKYKVYTALLTQSGTDAPVATVLENTLGGNVVWSREDVGVYTGVLNGAFIQDKTFLYSKNKVYSSDDSTEYSLSDSDINKVYVTTTVAGALEDGVMLRTPIEIRVYN